MDWPNDDPGGLEATARRLQGELDACDERIQTEQELRRAIMREWQAVSRMMAAARRDDGKGD